MGQVRAFWELEGHRFKALRAGRRFGKTDLCKRWIGEGFANGWECAWFAPKHKTWSESFTEMVSLFAPVLLSASKNDAVMRSITGGRLDFWTLENEMAGRSRRYRRVVIDEAAFTKNSTMMDIWEKSIKPTLFDYGGEALICSNSAGKDPDNFFYRICTDPKYGFHEFHAPTSANPYLPKRHRGETPIAWLERRGQYLGDLIKDNDPLVYAQEHLAEFVDWAGVAFFSIDKMLVSSPSGLVPVPAPRHCDGVFAIIDTASKTGTEYDGTAVTYFAVTTSGNFPLIVLDWDIQQIEGALLETWLPTVFQMLEGFAKDCGARNGSLGCWIEDKNSGTVLLQNAIKRGWSARPIESKLTSLGKDERAISVSGYHYREMVKISETAYHKTKTYKRATRNHLLEQISSFRVGDPQWNTKADDLADCYMYGLAIALGNSEGF
jgi:hypothetical protein